MVNDITEDDPIRHIKYGDDTIYLMSYVRIPVSTPVGNTYGMAAIGFVIDFKRGDVVDSSITFLSEESKIFFKELTVGFNMNENIEILITVIRRRFLVASQKAICVAIKDLPLALH